MTIARRRLVIAGKVQGVNYRASTRNEAVKLGLSGYVGNLPDGQVEVVVEGEETALARLTDWCQHGPPSARVTSVSVDIGPATKEFGGFSVRH